MIRYRVCIFLKWFDSMLYVMAFPIISCTFTDGNIYICPYYIYDVLSLIILVYQRTTRQAGESGRTWDVQNPAHQDCQSHRQLFPPGS